jgi:adenylate cyclase
MFRFEGYTLDIARNELRNSDREVALRPKTFELLRYLVENPDRLVTKEELLKAIWPNVTVTDQVLAHCVSEVREAIGDGDQAIIKTIRRRGYRFVAPVVRVATSAAAAPPSAYAAPPLVGGWGGGSRGGPKVPYSSAPAPDPSTQGGEEMRTEGPRPASSAPGSRSQAEPYPSAHTGESRVGDRASVAVLPFANLSGDPEQDFFSDGITEDITTELSRFSELIVIARNSAFQYKGKAVDIRQVGRELGARYVLEGSVRRSGNRVRITAQLVDATTGAHRWADRYDRELVDVFAVQDEVARAIVAILAAHVKRAEIERVLLKPPAAWEAYEYYLRGAEAFFLHQSKCTKASLYEARRLLEQSLAIDPDYSRATAMLARTHLHAYIEPFDGDHLSPAALDRALELAETAVHLDPHLPQARAQLGHALLLKRQHDAAIAEFERAFALNPNSVDHRFAHALTCAGEHARAIEVVEAIIRLDPFQPLHNAFGQMGWTNYMLRRYCEAVRLLSECVSRVPNLQWPHVMLAAAYAQSGQLEEARKEAAEVLRINPAFTIERYKGLAVYKDPKDAEHRLDGLRKAGLPES